MAVSSAEDQNTKDRSRRTADYHPSVWGDFFINLVTTDKKFRVLKKQLRMMLTATEEDSLEKLNSIDMILRLGIGYHFEREVEEALENIHKIIHQFPRNEDLNTVALRFRLLREHGYYVSSYVFNGFKNEKGNFKGNLTNDLQGLMGLYEASYLGMHGEKTLDDALLFTKTHLTSILNGQLPSSLGDDQVSHSLHWPLQRSVAKFKQFHYISLYKQDHEAHNEVILKLAKMDFNIVQNLYQLELKSLSRWWVELDLASKLPFFRDRLIECYLCGLGVFPEPELDFSRRVITKGCLLFTVVDDMYDVHATIDELELFTDTVERWDTSFKDLPDYMKLCFQLLIDLVQEIEEETTKMGRPYCVQYVKQAIKRNLRAYLQEARWYHEGHVPEVEEYRENGAFTTTLPLMSFIAAGGIKDVSVEVFDWLATDPKILVTAADHFRLTDDVVTHEIEQERGDVASAVECYMKQYEASKEEAYDEIDKLIELDWRHLNEEIFKETAIPKRILTIFLDYARVINLLWKDTDSFTKASTGTKDIIAALLVHPIAL
ncbi:hypothetical protein Tsubulata_047209 [Turnera subulata]|uniref:Uncharacterized protein n=1 Tax=Turnera subulata TaxID=218843 RepID=A0A9Q0F5K7_9ROSI|nr:hypothetical protein Tsubulata_047209 [Turnera subulata]